MTVDEQQMGERVKCAGCGNEIDPEVCGCGETIAEGVGHGNHSPIPMGCDCYRALSSKEKP